MIFAPRCPTLTPQRSGRLMTMFTRERESGPARLGIAATRKMGAAVERNRAKRLVRELFVDGVQHDRLLSGRKEA